MFLEQLKPNECSCIILVKGGSSDDNLLKRALANNTDLEMIYLDNKGNLSQRRIKVLSVNNESFRAYCYNRKQQRTFKVSNVLSTGPVRNMKRGA